MNVSKIVAELRAERDRLDKAIAALENVNSNHGRNVQATTRSPNRKRSRMSAAARKRLSDLLKKRWASGKMRRRKVKAA